MKPPPRVDGFSPIEGYAVLGDGRTAALVAADGRLDWWPVPDLDAPPICAALLDPDRGGHVLMAPDEPFEVARRYLEGTNVLEATYTTGSGEVRVTQALNSGSAGRLPWTELALRVEGTRGSVPMRWELVPGDRFGRANPWVHVRRGVPLAVVQDQTAAVVTERAGAVTVGAGRVEGRFVTEVGRRSIVGIVVSDDQPVFLPDARAVDERLDRSVASWERWSGLLAVQCPWEGAVRRSALALKTLLAEDSGAIAAAATTSLPEGVGGEKNWDYRYAWVRDSSFTLDALINLGLHEEVHGAVTWILDALRRNGPDLHVFYTLGGELADGQRELDIPGYRHSRPVRAGNGAAGQVQLGTYGDLFDTVARYCAEGHVLDQATGLLLAGLADRCCDSWRQKDSGIWELDRLEHYTISKIGCWVALDRAARLAASGQLPGTRAGRWRAEADAVRQWVDTNCWSVSRRAYTFYPGTDDLDAAVLLAGRTGFDRGERLEATVEAVLDELGHGPLVYRYSGVEDEEGAFVACTFWSIEALALVGQVARARHLMDAAVALANDVGLLSEQIDPTSGAFLGNVPQGLSHLALVNAAFTLARAGHGGEGGDGPEAAG